MKNIRLNMTLLYLLILSNTSTLGHMCVLSHNLKYIQLCVNSEVKNKQTWACIHAICCFCAEKLDDNIYFTYLK